MAALDGQEGGLSASGLRVTTAERSFGAALTGAIHRGELRAPVRLALRGAAGQSFGAWAGEGVSLVLEGTANDYVGKGLSGGHLVVRPAPEMLAGAAASPSRPPAPRRSRSPATPACTARPAGGCTSSAGPGCGSRSATRAPRRSSRASGPHGCEYMTGGAVVVLGPVGQSFGAGMTGGRAYLWDPSGRHVAALHGPSVRAVRLAEAAATREDGDLLVAELLRLLGAHRDAGSALAARLFETGDAVLADVWLVEPVPAAPVVVAAAARRDGGRRAASRPGGRPRRATEPQPGRRLSGVEPRVPDRETMTARRRVPWRRCPRSPDDLPRLRHQPHRRGHRRPQRPDHLQHSAAAGCSAPPTARSSGSTSPRWAAATRAAA